MKSLKYIALLFLSLHYCYAQQVTIHFKGKIYTEKNSSIGGANINVVQDEFLPSSTQADADGNYNLYLPLNREFDITVSKEGYVQKKYFVSTKGIKEDQKLAKFPDYVADVVLFTRVEGVDYSLFDQPINKYSYNPKNHNMDYDEQYLSEDEFVKNFGNPMAQVDLQRRRVFIEEGENSISLKYSYLCLFSDNFFQILSPSSKQCKLEFNTSFLILIFSSFFSFFVINGGVKPFFK